MGLGSEIFITTSAAPAGPAPKASEKPKNAVRTIPNIFFILTSFI
jgi:hypothetical protein